MQDGKAKRTSPVPECTAGCFRTNFFFSFLGLIVSVLGFGLSVPLLPSGLVPVATATWGRLRTVSVSTVMFWVEPSVLDLFGCFADMALVCRVMRGGGGTEAVLRDSVLWAAGSAASCSAVGLGFEVGSRPASAGALSERLSGNSRFSLIWSTEKGHTRDKGMSGLPISCEEPGPAREGAERVERSGESSRPPASADAGVVLVGCGEGVAC